MWRELRITLVIMIVALIVFSPAIFAAPGPAPTNYLALVMHIIAPTATPTATPALVSTKTPSLPTITRTGPPTQPPTVTKTPAPPTATPNLPPPSYNNCQADPNPSAAPNYPVRITNINKVAETVTLQNTSTSTVDLGNWNMCSITGNQHHPIGGTLAPGASQTFPGPAGNIWNNSTEDDGALYNPAGQLVSYFNS
jgi:hypothetical protein